MLVILAGPDGMSGICLGPADGPTLETLWFSKPQHAEIVFAQCPEGWVDCTAAELLDTVVNTAATLGASFRTTAEVEAEAASAVAEITAKVEEMRRSGDLAKVNATYKAYRVSQSAKGEKAIPYSAHLAAFTRSLVVLAAQNPAPR